MKILELNANRFISLCNTIQRGITIELSKLNTILSINSSNNSNNVNNSVSSLDVGQNRMSKRINLNTMIGLTNNNVKLLYFNNNNRAIKVSIYLFLLTFSCMKIIFL